MEVARAVSRRATCLRRKVGAVLVREGRIIATGYNGSLPGAEHCEDVGCLMVNGHCKRTLHAELNAILQCAKFGIAAAGAVCYVTLEPCTDCRKALEAAGVIAIRWDESTPYVKEYEL